LHAPPGRDLRETPHDRAGIAFHVICAVSVQSCVFARIGMHYQRYGKAHRKCIWSDEIGLIRCIHCISAVNHAGAESSPRAGRAIDDDSDEVHGFSFQLVGMTEWLQI
jgi:hypothetical protein